MTEVRFHFVAADGTPIANTRFQVTLPTAAFDSTTTSFVLPKKIMGETDAEGRASLNLAPLANHPYTVLVSDWNSRAKLQEEFYVPESIDPVHLVDLVNAVADDQYDFQQETIDLINTARSSARASKEDAELARDAAQTAETGAALSEKNSKTSETATLGYRDESRTVRDEINDMKTALVLLQGEVDQTALTVDQDATQVALDKDTVVAKVNEIQGIVTLDIDPKVAHVDSQVTAIDGQKTYIDGQVTHVDTQVNGLNLDRTWIGEQRTYVDGRIDYFEGTVVDLQNQIGSVDEELTYMQNQRTYLDDTFKPEMVTLRDETRTAADGVSGVKDDIFMIATNGGSIFTKHWPVITTVLTQALDFSAESTHFITIGAGADVTFTFTGWPADGTKYVVLVMHNGGRGVIRFPSTVQWQNRGGVAPILKENGTDTLVLWHDATYRTAAGNPVVFAARAGR